MTYLSVDPIFDELRDDTAGTLIKIYRFLGIDNLIPANINKAYYSNKKLIKSGPVRNLLTGGFARFLYTRLPDGLIRRMKSIFKMKSLYSDTDISEETMAKLKEFYKEEIKRTEEVTGFDLSAWKV